MRLVDYITLGFKNIWRRKSRSFLTIFAVVIGAISMVIMLSLVLGAQQVATRQLESIDGLTLISVSANPEIQSNGNLLSTDTGPDETTQKLNDSQVEAVKKIPHVIDATPLIGVWVKSFKLEGQDKKYYGSIVGYNPGTKVLNLPISVGRQLTPDDMDKVVVGSDILRNYGYTTHPEDIIGKKLIFYVQDYVDWGDDPPKPPENADDKYWESQQNTMHEISAEIVGVIGTGADNGQNYITDTWARRLMISKSWKYNDSRKNEGEKTRNQLAELLKSQEDAQRKLYIQELMKEVTDNGIMREMLDDWNKQYEQNISEQLGNIKDNNSNMLYIVKQDNLARNGYGSILVRADNTANIDSVGKEIKKLGLGVSTAKDMLDQIKKIFGLVGLIIGAIGGIVLFVAALGIINNMIMATYERTREIGILRACGATKSTIRNMFIFEAAALGFLGGAIGLVVSFGLAKIMNIIGNSIAVSQGVPISNLISFPLWLIIGVVSLTTVIGTIAGLLPAIHASNLDPVEALRYE